MKTAEEIHAEMYSKKLKDGSHEGWEWMSSFAGKIKECLTIEVIRSHLALGHKVKAGYTCTQIRGYHDRWILIKDTKP
jgi:hypothetical protein